MKRSLLLLPLLGACKTSPEPLLEPINKVELLYGLRLVEEDDFAPVDEQEAIGLALVFLPAGTGFGGEAGYVYSKDDEDTPGRDAEGRLWGLYGGMRFSYGSGRVRPYGSWGLSYDELVRDTDPDSERNVDDDNWGIYVQVGCDVWATEVISLGLLYRMNFDTHQNIGSVISEYGYDLFAFTVGFAF